MVNQGERGDKFYIILQGIVTINIKNPKIPDWKARNQDLKYLLKWKSTVFDPKCEQIKKELKDSEEQK